jgi:alpha/beta superfamily hydrolase
VSPGTDTAFLSAGLRLSAHLARPPLSAGRIAPLGLVLCHGLPVGAGAAGTAGHTFPQLADRIAADSGWACLSFCLRGAGTSEGDFSVAGWLEDLRSGVAFLRAEGVDNVWLAGFSTGGTMAMNVAASDPDIHGVAALSAPSDLSSWSNDPSYLLGLARQVGVISAGQEPDLSQWAKEVLALDPLGSAARIPPRPFFLAHGSADDTVPLVDARALADAAGGQCELHVIPMAGHRLRHDPRAIAMLLGWLDRQAT